LSPILILVGIFSGLAFGFNNPNVDALFAEFNKPSVPGASVAIFQDGKILYEKGYGLADLENHIAATPDTQYRLASVSKQFTAMAILLLIDQGRLSLGNSITDIFPEFPPYGKKIKILHLLGHTGGLKDYEDFVPSIQSKQLTDLDVLKIYQQQSSGMFAAGEQYHYSNGGYVLLGLIVEKVAGINFGTYLKKNLFDAVGMKDAVLLQPGVNVPNRAYGYSPSGVGFHKTDQNSTSATRGDGCIYLSAREYFFWETALEKSSLIHPDLQKLAFTAGTLNSGAKTDYGFGWMLGTYKGFPRAYHTGSTIGFRTAVERLPSQKFSVVVLANRANSDPWNIARKIVDLYN
jgi:CubicO group peptidase (beta-lactamase class C family)